MELENLEKLEMDLLLEGVFKRYGYDFRGYSRASLTRRVKRLMIDLKLNRVLELLTLVIDDEVSFRRFLNGISVSVTEAFRDPRSWRTLRDCVHGEFGNFPYLKAWSAGCATGEEAYSLAIVLSELGRGNQALIYGTDINERSITSAAAGIYPYASIEKFTSNYLDYGGTQVFSDYYQVDRDLAVMSPELKNTITFSNHNLVTDYVFSEVQFVCCRNVLIYFNRDLQNRALELFDKSLCRGGILWLGNRESIDFSPVKGRFETISAADRIYRKVS